MAYEVLHYPLWSPDSNLVAFIAVTSGGLTLFVDDPLDRADPDASPEIIADGILGFWSPR